MKKTSREERYDLLPTDVAFHSFMGLAGVGYLMIESPFSAVKSISDSLCRGCSGSYLNGTPAIRIIAGFSIDRDGLNHSDCIAVTGPEKSFQSRSESLLPTDRSNVNRDFSLARAAA